VVEEAAFVYCECGYKILCVVPRQGVRVDTLAFFDVDDDEEVTGEAERRVTHCPGCGERLGSHVLVPKRRPPD
jgi:DNA-directed RNA polymerase subunit RPC12/RpoP